MTSMDGHQRENTSSSMIELAIKGDQLTMLGDLPDSNILFTYHR